MSSSSSSPSPMKASEVWHFALQLHRGDEFTAVWRYASDPAQAPRTWKGTVTSAADGQAIGGDAYAVVKFPELSEPVDFPQDGENGTESVQYFSLVKQPRMSPAKGRTRAPGTGNDGVVPAVPARTPVVEGPDDAETRVDERGEAFAIEPRPESPEYALEPSRWCEVVYDSTSAHLMKAYLRDRFVRTTAQHDKHTVGTCLDSLGYSMHTIARYPGLCKDDDWIKAQRTLLQRLLLLEYKNEGMTATSLAAIDTAFRDEEQPEWVKRGRDRAVASLKVLTYTQQGRGRGSGGRGRGGRGKADSN
eukprot:PhM_4_TR15898/c2_g1_i1/m.71903